jgi:hypothetical protein
MSGVCDPIERQIPLLNVSQSADESCARPPTFPDRSLRSHLTDNEIITDCGSRLLSDVGYSRNGPFHFQMLPWPKFCITIDSSGKTIDFWVSGLAAQDCKKSFTFPVQLLLKNSRLRFREYHRLGASNAHFANFWRKHTPESTSFNRLSCILPNPGLSCVWR